MNHVTTNSIARSTRRRPVAVLAIAGAAVLIGLQIVNQLAVFVATKQSSGRWQVPPDLRWPYLLLELAGWTVPLLVIGVGGLGLLRERLYGHRVLIAGLVLALVFQVTYAIVGYGPRAVAIAMAVLFCGLTLFEARAQGVTREPSRLRL